MVGGRPAPVSLPTTRSGGGSELCLMRTTMCISTKTQVHQHSHNQVCLDFGGQCVLLSHGISIFPILIL